MFHDIVLHEQRLGTLYIQSDMQQWYARLRNYTAIVGILMLGAALFALLLSSRTAAGHLAADPRSRADHEDGVCTKTFSLRVTKTQDDEIGALIDGFNEMLGEIQRRDAALQCATAPARSSSRKCGAPACAGRAEDAQHDPGAARRRAERGRRAARRGAGAVEGCAARRQTRILQSILDTMSDGVIVADEQRTRHHVQPGGERRCCTCEVEDTLTSDWIARHGFYLPDTVTAYPHDQFPLIRPWRESPSRAPWSSCSTTSRPPMGSG